MIHSLPPEFRAVNKDQSYYDQDCTGYNKPVFFPVDEKPYPKDYTDREYYVGPEGFPVKINYSEVVKKKDYSESDQHKPRYYRGMSSIVHLKTSIPPVSGFIMKQPY